MVGTSWCCAMCATLELPVFRAGSPLTTFGPVSLVNDANEALDSNQINIKIMILSYGKTNRGFFRTWLTVAVAFGDLLRKAQRRRRETSRSEYWVTIASSAGSEVRRWFEPWSATSCRRGKLHSRSRSPSSYRPSRCYEQLFRGFEKSEEVWWMRD